MIHRLNYFYFFQVKEAFNKKALTCHPDKNPSPEAAEQFGRCYKAYKILIDAEARKAYENVYRSRKQREANLAKLDSKQRKLKQDLEAREKAFLQEKDEESKLAREIERLRKEGVLAVDEISSMKVNVKDDGTDLKETRVKISWKKASVNTDEVKKLFERFGEIQDFVMTSKGNSALIVYKRQSSAINANNSPLTSGFKIKILNLDANLVFKMASEKLTQPPVVDTFQYEQEVLEKLRKRAHIDSDK